MACTMCMHATATRMSTEFICPTYVMQFISRDLGNVNISTWNMAFRARLQLFTALRICRRSFGIKYKYPPLSLSLSLSLSRLGNFIADLYRFPLWKESKQMKPKKIRGKQFSDLLNAGDASFVFCGVLFSKCNPFIALAWLFQISGGYDCKQ